MRLNRYLSQCGAGSRRGCEQLILEGRVTVNGHIVTELATQVEDGAQVTVNGKPVRRAEGVVVAFHKPKGFICSRGDTHDRATIYSILPPQYQSLHYVGRLDKESEGLLLLTNRGELSQRLTHPSEGVEKEYEVTTDIDFQPEHKLKLLHGMLTEEGHAKAEKVWVDSSRRIKVVLKQGLKRQIRLMFYQLGYEVERLVRIRIGGLYLKGMQRGAWKELSDAEVERYFIRHKEREKPVRTAKSKTDDGDDHFSSESASPAPFKLRPGPRSTAAGVRKPRGNGRTSEGSLASKPKGRPSRKAAREFSRPERDEDANFSEDSSAPASFKPRPGPRSAPSGIRKPKRFAKSEDQRGGARPAKFAKKKPGGFSKSGNKPPRGGRSSSRPGR